MDTCSRRSGKGRTGHFISFRVDLVTNIIHWLSNMEETKNSDNPYELSEESLAQIKETDLAFTFKILGLIFGPLISLLMLYLWSPTTDLGEILAFLGWPMLHFIIGLVLSFFEQPRFTADNEGKITSVSHKKKMTAYNYRLGWILLLAFFEFFGAIFVLSLDQHIPALFWAIPVMIYCAYLLFAIVWFYEVKELKRCSSFNE